MKRPFDPIPDNVRQKQRSSEDVEGEETGSKREFPKRKVAMVLGYSGTGYQGMQR